MSNMFCKCPNLTEIDVSKFDTSNVTNYETMFNYVPTTIQIMTNQNTKNWILDKFPSYTNIIVV